jgi:hypothetical protein
MYDYTLGNAVPCRWIHFGDLALVLGSSSRRFEVCYFRPTR